MWPPVRLGGCLATRLPDLRGTRGVERSHHWSLTPHPWAVARTACQSFPVKSIGISARPYRTCYRPRPGGFCGVRRRLPKARRFADPLGASTGRRSDDDPSRAGEAVTRGRVFLWPSWRTSPSSAPGWSVSGWRGARARCRRLRHGRAARRARWREGAVGGRHRATATVTADPRNTAPSRCRAAGAPR